jgi:hypothetical protein
MRYFILALFAALIVMVPSAGATAVKVAPTYSITSAAVSGKNVKFTITVTVTGVPKCSGKVTATYKISKKKSVSWTGRYTGDSAICTAKINGKLPKASFGKKVKFAIKFPGNDSIKKFSTSKSLTLSPPPPPAPPAPVPTPPTGPDPIPLTTGPQTLGLWSIEEVTQNNTDFSFILSEDYIVYDISRFGGGLSVVCPSGNVSTTFNWSKQFTMRAKTGQVSYQDTGPNNHMTYTFDWDFSGPNTGTGHFDAVGDINIGGGTWVTCSRSFNFDMAGGS